MSYVTLRCYNTCYVIFWCKSRCMRTFERHRAWVEAGERGLPDCSGSMVGEGVGRKARRGLPSVTNYFLDTPFRRATVLDRVPFALTGARRARTLCALPIQRQPGVEARSWSLDQKQPACFCRRLVCLWAAGRGEPCARRCSIGLPTPVSVAHPIGSGCATSLQKLERTMPIQSSIRPASRFLQTVASWK